MGCHPLPLRRLLPPLQVSTSTNSSISSRGISSSSSSSNRKIIIMTTMMMIMMINIYLFFFLNQASLDMCNKLMVTGRVTMVQIITLTYICKSQKTKTG